MTSAIKAGDRHANAVKCGVHTHLPLRKERSNMHHHLEWLTALILTCICRMIMMNPLDLHMLFEATRGTMARQLRHKTHCSTRFQSP